jgi:hypothetical protein
MGSWTRCSEQFSGFHFVGSGSSAALGKATAAAKRRRANAGPSMRIRGESTDSSRPKASSKHPFHWRRRLFGFVSSRR